MENQNGRKKHTKSTAQEGGKPGKLAKENAGKSGGKVQRKEHRFECSEAWNGGSALDFRAEMP